MVKVWFCYCNSGTYGDGRSVRRVQDHTNRLRTFGGSDRYWHSYTSCCTAFHRSPQDSLRTGNKSTTREIEIMSWWEKKLRGKPLVSGRKGANSPSWHKSPLTPGGQRQLPVTGSQVAPFLHLQGKEQFLPNCPSAHAMDEKLKS